MVPMRFSALFLTTMLAIPSVSWAEESTDSLLPGTFSGSAALTTDYMFRGISQTDESPAVQAGF